MFASIFGFDPDPTATIPGWYHVKQHYNYDWNDTYAVQFVLPLSLKSVKITDETVVGCGAFSDCRMLSSIFIPKTVSICNESIFNGCSSLVDLTLPFAGSVKGRGDQATPANCLFGHIFGPNEYAGSYKVF